MAISVILSDALCRVRRYCRVASPQRCCGNDLLVLACFVGCVSTINLHNAIADTSDRAPPAIHNSSLKLSFDARRGELQQLFDIATQHDFIASRSQIDLWQITTTDGRKLTPAEANSFAWHNVGNQLILEWSNFQGDEQLRVTATVTLDDHSPISRWRIAVAGLRKFAIRTIAFPRIGLITPSEQETLAVPQWIGEITHQIRSIVNPSGKDMPAKRREWDYPGILSMQFLAYYTGTGSGILVAADDTQLMRKQFAAFGDGANGLGLEVVHHAPQDQGRNAAITYAPPYSVTVQPFDGDWFTAAELYRQWANNQTWVRDSRARKHETPAWVRDTALWVWNRGQSDDVLSPALALQKHANLPVSVFWHWWHGCAYDVGFPEYLPPREGTAKFRTAVAAANAQGIHEIVYMNQRLWGMTTKSWTTENAAAAAVKEIDGRVQPEVYNTFVKAPCASMCMGTPFWRNTYATLAERAIRELGVAGVYMDQACTSRACYDPAHGHPLGGGTYWMEGFKSLEHDIRQRCHTVRDVALAGEGCGEGWLPHLDMMLSLQVSMERYAAPNEWEPIPLFNVVYHDCATQFGNYSSLTRPPYDELWPKEFAPAEPLSLLDQKFAAQFRLEQARAFVWGQQPSIANFQVRQLHERREEIAFVLKLARLRKQALTYLRDGVFLRPPEIHESQFEIPISRLSIYAGQQDAVKEYRKTVPKVLVSLLQAPDGDVGLVLVNISDQRLPVRLSLSRPTTPIHEVGSVIELSERGHSEMASYANGAVDLNITLEPTDARIYEIKGK